MPLVVITDSTFPTIEIEESILRPHGFEVVHGQCRTVETLVPMVRSADAVITQFAPVKSEVVDAMTRAKVIVRYGIGVDNIDLESARRRGIPVCNVPDYCIDEVADHTLAFMLSITRQIIPNCLHIREGNWGLAAPIEQFRTLAEQTVGIIGFGRIGKEVAARLAPFRCRRLVFDPVIPEDIIREAGCDPVSLPELLGRSNIVTLHCPSTANTRKILNAEALARLPAGAIVINAARGDLIDTAALVDALQSGHLGGAALDVCDPEPIPADCPLRSLPNVIAASHLASVSPRAVRTLRETVARIALAALLGTPIPNIVNGVG